MRPSADTRADRDDVVAMLARSFDQVVEWVVAHRYRAYEPADGNASALFPLTQGRIFPMRLLQQAVLRSPFNIRPLLGIAPHESAIARGYFALGFLERYRVTGDERLRSEAVACLEWLLENRAVGYDGYGWGDPYEYATRGGRRPLGEPILVWTAFIGHAFLDAYEILDDTAYIDAARSIGRWVLQLPRECTSNGDCLSYAAYTQSFIHNANIVGASFLARLGTHAADQNALRVARSAVEYTCSRQRPDGSWFYAEAPAYHWIDNFHTGYNLAALDSYQRVTGDSTFESALLSGARFFVDHFFEADGRPKYFHNRTQPVDIQCAAQAIETLVRLSSRLACA